MAGSFSDYEAYIKKAYEYVNTGASSLATRILRRV